MQDFARLSIYSVNNKTKYTANNIIKLSVNNKNKTYL